MMDDQAALEDMRNGGQKGFTVLYKRYVKSLRSRLIAKHQIPADAVDDVLQDSFLKFINTIHGFKGDCSVSTWLHLIAHSVAMDFLRGRGDTVSTETVDIDALLELLSTEQFKQEQHDLDIQMCLERAWAQLERDGSKASLFNCLKALTFQAQGSSIQDIAEEIGRTPDATRRYLSDCRTKLGQYQPIQRCRQLLKGD